MSGNLTNQASGLQRHDFPEADLWGVMGAFVQFFRLLRRESKAISTTNGS